MSRPLTSAVVATVVALVLSPSLASGQYITPRADNNPFAGKPAPMAPVSVARAILEHDHDMKLTDGQRDQIVAIQRRLDSAAIPLLRRLDSLRPTWRPAGGANDLSPEQRQRIQENWSARAALVDSLVPQFTKAREQVMALLNDDQRGRAAKLEKEARKRAEEAAKKELQDGPMQFERGERRRGEIRHDTGGAALG